MNGRLLGLFITIIAVFGIAACGGDDDDSSDGSTTGASDPIVVVASDLAFDDDAYDAAAGTVAISYENEGAIPHTLVIEDVDGFKLDVTANGDVDEGSVDLDAGEYTIFCDVPGHRDAGMEATLEIS